MTPNVILGLYMYGAHTHTLERLHMRAHIDATRITHKCLPTPDLIWEMKPFTVVTGLFSTVFFPDATQTSCSGREDMTSSGSPL